MKKLHKDEKGQALLLVVLVMIVASTIGLSLVSRSIVQVKTAKDSADSQKAFSAAEAGIEQALQTGNGAISQSLGNNASIGSVSIATTQGSKFILNNNTQVLQDEGIDLWLATYPTYQNPWTGTVRVYWGTVPDCDEAAVEIIIISQPSGYTMNHYAYDPCSSRVINGNHFTQPAANSGGTIQGKTFAYSVPIDIPNGLIARIIPLYHDTTIAVAGFTNSTESTIQSFPSQGKIITSIGSSGSTQREIQYYQGYSVVPSELFYSLFAP